MLWLCLWYKSSSASLQSTYVVSTCLLSSQSPIVLSRDHHDVSGTDSPFRETSNIYDGSSLCAGEYFRECREKKIFVYGNTCRV